jgi:molybdopterin converting factor small subunit
MNRGNGDKPIRVKFYGPLRDFVSAEEQMVQGVEGTPIRKLITELGVPDDQLVYTMCLVNERRVPLDTPVAEGDILDVFQPVAGG